MPNRAMALMHKANIHCDKARNLLMSDSPEGAQTMAAIGLLEVQKAAQTVDNFRSRPLDPAAADMIDLTLQLHQIYTEARIRQGLDLSLELGRS